jgi:hypothetical protein
MLFASSRCFFKSHGKETKKGKIPNDVKRKNKSLPETRGFSMAVKDFFLK